MKRPDERFQDAWAAVKRSQPDAPPITQVSEAHLHSKAHYWYTKGFAEATAIVQEFKISSRAVPNGQGGYDLTEDAKETLRRLVVELLGCQEQPGKR